MTTTSTGGGAAAAPKPARNGRTLQMRVLAVLILLAVVASVIVDWQNSSTVAANSRAQLAQATALHKLTECQTRINEQFLTAIKGRATASNQAQDALTHLIGTIPLSAAAGKGFAVAFHKALVNYDDTIARINAARPKLPPLPDTACH